MNGRRWTVEAKNPRQWVVVVDAASESEVTVASHVEGADTYVTLDRDGVRHLVLALAEAIYPQEPAVLVEEVAP